MSIFISFVVALFFLTSSIAQEKIPRQDPPLKLEKIPPPELRLQPESITTTNSIKKLNKKMEIKKEEIYLYKITCWDDSGKQMIFSNDRYNPDEFCPQKGMRTSPPMLKGDKEDLSSDSDSQKRKYKHDCYTQDGLSSEVESEHIFAANACSEKKLNHMNPKDPKLELCHIHNSQYFIQNFYGTTLKYSVMSYNCNQNEKDEKFEIIACPGIAAMDLKGCFDNRVDISGYKNLPWEQLIKRLEAKEKITRDFRDQFFKFHKPSMNPSLKTLPKSHEDLLDLDKGLPILKDPKPKPQQTR